VTIPVTVLWAATSFRLALIDPEAEKAVDTSPLVFWLWVGASLYFLALSIWRTVRPDLLGR
jgi:phosphatidylcholine synthase